MDEKNLLKSALSEALGQKEQVQMQYGQLQREHAQLVHEDNSLKNQVGVQACEDEGHRVGGSVEREGNRVCGTTSTIVWHPMTLPTSGLPTYLPACVISCVCAHPWFCRAQVAFATDMQVQAEQQLSLLQKEVELKAASLDAAAQELSVKTARLEHLEGRVGWGSGRCA